MVAGGPIFNLRQRSNVRSHLSRYRAVSDFVMYLSEKVVIASPAPKSRNKQFAVKIFKQIKECTLPIYFMLFFNRLADARSSHSGPAHAVQRQSVALRTR
jgi:hypothetical protein